MKPALVGNDATEGPDSPPQARDSESTSHVDPDAPISTRVRAKYNQLKDRYQRWKKDLVYKTREADPLTQELGEGWEGLGYHRPVAKFFYSIWTVVPQALFGLMLLPLLQYTEYRFPEISGIRFATEGLFAAVYSILDLNLKDAMNRYVPEQIIKDPRRAMAYVSFFIKYQMWSGLFQILGISLIVQFYIIPGTEFSYLAWYLLFVCIKQYPATLMTFKSLLESFQRFNKAHLAGIYEASFIRPLTSLAGGVLGLLYGINNPVIGELYGMTLGWAIGNYADDFFSFGLGSYWLSKILDQYGIRLREMYFMKIPRDVWRSALGYSMRLMPKTVFGAVMGFSGFVITVQSVPGYLTFVGLTGAANDLTFILGYSDDILGASQPGFSESYNNGKRVLCKYYIASGLKWWGFWFLLFGSINIFAMPVILDIAINGGFIPATWSMVGIMIPWYILQKLNDPFEGVTDKMISVSDHPEIKAGVDILKTIINLFFTWYFLLELQLGWWGLIMKGFPAELIGMVIKMVFMQKKIIRLEAAWWRDIAWQAFAAPALSGVFMIGFMLLVLRGLWPIASAGLVGMQLVGMAIPIVLLLISAVVWLYVPLYSFFGGWDKYTLLDFRRAIPLTGPSIVLTYPLLKLSEKFHAKSPFKKIANFSIGEEAYQELVELARIRAKHYAKLKTALKKAQ